MRPSPHRQLHSNYQTVGYEPLDILADRIWHSVGPSGRNKVGALSTHLKLAFSNQALQDYLYHLAAAVRQLAPESHDSHLYLLEVSNSPPVLTYPDKLQTECREWDKEREQGNQ